MKNIFLYSPPVKKAEFELKSDGKNTENKTDMEKVSRKIAENKRYVEETFSVPLNGDIVVRDFKIFVGSKSYDAFFVICDGLADGDSVNECVLKPFMYLKNSVIPKGETLDKIITGALLPQNQISVMSKIKPICDEVNFGLCALFVDTLEVGFSIDLKGWEHRGVDVPQNEKVILGPHEGFNEMLRTNTALIRKTVKNSNLVMESISLGKKSQTGASIAYIKGVTNKNLIDEVRFRCENINVDYIFTSHDLEQYIEDNSFVPAPQIFSTERPDRVCKALVQGRVAIVVSGSPNVLVVPATFLDFTKTAEDEYLRYPFAVMLRLIRMLAIFLTLFSSALFIAITNYHQDLILTDILFSLEYARHLVPFPSAVEIIMMEISFELIKEAGVRVPDPIGQTLGIVGGLILGQAAVEANIVSPIAIIIVSITGLCSFIVPSYSFAFSFRLLRFVYIIGAAAGGFLGILTVLFVNLAVLFSLKSFGVNYTSPIAPKNSKNAFASLFVVPLWKKERRPDYLKPEEEFKQAKISREWKYKKR